MRVQQNINIILKRSQIIDSLIIIIIIIIILTRKDNGKDTVQYTEVSHAVRGFVPVDGQLGNLSLM